MAGGDDISRPYKGPRDDCPVIPDWAFDTLWTQTPQGLKRTFRGCHLYVRTHDLPGPQSWYWRTFVPCKGGGWRSSDDEHAGVTFHGEDSAKVAAETAVVKWHAGRLP